MAYKFIIGFCAVFYFLAVAIIAWNFLSPKRLQTSKREISYQQRKRIVFLFALVFGFMVTAVILLLSFFAPSFSSFADKFISSSGEFMKKLPPYFVVTFLLVALLVLYAFVIALSSWSRTKKGYVLLFIGFGLYFLSMLFRTISINQPALLSENIMWLNMTFTLTSIPVFIIAAIMLLTRKRRR